MEHQSYNISQFSCSGYDSGVQSPLFSLKNIIPITLICGVGIQFLGFCVPLPIQQSVTTISQLQPPESIKTFSLSVERNETTTQAEMGLSEVPVNILTMTSEGVTFMSVPKITRYSDEVKKRFAEARMFTNEEEKQYDQVVKHIFSVNGRKTGRKLKI